MNEMVYHFKDDARFRSDFDKEAGSARMASILARDGYLGIKEIVEDGINPSSPLHPEFVVDAKTAIAAYREERAEYLRRHFVITVTDEITKEKSTIRATVQIEDDHNPGRKIFVATLGAMSDAEKRKQVLWSALKELIAVRQKYRTISELARVFEIIDETAKNYREDEGTAA